MDYFSKFLRPNPQSPPKQIYNHAAEYQKAWTIIYDTLTHPDERQLARGIRATAVPAALKTMVDSLVWESTRMEEGMTGACMEYLLKNDVLGTLVRLSEPDRPSGIQVEVLRTVQNMVVLLDEQFLVHSVVHRAVLRLLKTCVGDDIQEQLDGRNRVMGAAGNAVRASPTEYEEDLVDLLCLLCSRIRTFRELLMIFFYDKHWYHAETLASVPEEDDDDETADGADTSTDNDGNSTGNVGSDASISTPRAASPTPSQSTVTSAPVSSQTKKPEYEFILLNYLLRFVHREGKIGEFARAGLLFLMDVAMSPGVPVHRIGGDIVKPSPSSLSIQQQQTSASDPVADAALALAEYILDGDFCEVLGAGLGAVYSLLPSKLEIHMDPQHRPPHSQQSTMIIGGTGRLSEEDWEKFEVAQEKARANGMEYSSNPEFKARLEHFVKLLEFLQDVVRRNVVSSNDDGNVEPASFVGSAIVQSILDSVRRIFLENVLYPTILECSDADGSAVAVMSYIDVMFRTIQDQQFAETLIDFLVTEDDNDSLRHRPRTRPTLLLDSAKSAPPVSTRDKKAKRRKSSAMMLLEMEAPDARKQSEYFTSIGRFTLKDLLLTGMRSTSHATATTALQLMQTLLVYHCHLSVDRLFIFSYDPIESSSPSHPEQKVLSEDEEEVFSYPGADAEQTPRPDASFSEPELESRVPETSYSMHEQELGLYLGLVARIDPAHGRGAFSTGYNHYLRDAIVSISDHSCSSCTLDSTDKISPRHLLDVNDPVLSLVLQSFRHFYSNTPEQNVALTGMLAAISSCPERSLKGWLLFGTDGSSQPLKKETSLPELSDDGDDRSVDFGVNERLERNELPMPIHGAGPLSQPVVLSILQGLVSNLDRFRELLPHFDSFLAERRQGLVFSENLTDALSLSFDLSSNMVGMASSPSSTHMNAESTPPQKTKPKPRTGWASFLTPKKSKSRAMSPSRSDSASASPLSMGKTIEASPFGSHYQKTSAISVEPLPAPLPSSGPWAPSERRSFNMDEEDVFGSSGQWGEEKRSEPSGLTRAPEQEEGSKRVTLSQLLDNVVILEESIKELTAIIHARRSLGIDYLRYL
ncbi:uncharacterized protein FOMMEDRAFT_119098 [Fomitiporia mediterranea MF3/22]|uniref:uncharacterized protein n=1 Tax=Fomitiporia mediterranea (strain MF3/22) TaxID=694068 RepID=UPI0004408249|nr:uncharacterized protein FOMMEDRAFT_119098 [Fomitiporia mediterranea MF3/22]EJD05802.1 hypothetical protein FOMMEDRAFT_119098 [Fomitiporia mediterranea MF3/22]